MSMRRCFGRRQHDQNMHADTVAAAARTKKRQGHGSFCRRARAASLRELGEGVVPTLSLGETLFEARFPSRQGPLPRCWVLVPIDSTAAILVPIVDETMLALSSLRDGAGRRAARSFSVVYVLLSLCSLLSLYCCPCV